MSLRGWEHRVKGATAKREEDMAEGSAGCPLNATRREKQRAFAAQRLATPATRLPDTHALTAGLRLGGAGSCLTMGETMAGWGIPEVGRPGWAGATM